MKNIIIWGAGATAKELLSCLDYSKFKVIAFVDNDTMKAGRFFSFDGYLSETKTEKSAPIISADTLPTLDYEKLFICSLYENEISKQYFSIGGTKEKLIKYSEKNKVVEYLGTDYQLKKLSIDLELNSRLNRELIWSSVFNNTVSGYDWYNVKTLSLGRAAIGYNFAYALCRILNDFKPKSILELGLGQSSKILNSYADYYNNINYDTLEHDENWIKFFSLEHNIKNNIHKVDLVKDPTGETLYHYNDLTSLLSNKKYDFILIDAPFGFGNYKYSRIDLLPHIPSILSEDFVIMVDDYNRVGEQNMVVALKDNLKQHNIKYHKGIYKGDNDALVITSENWKFLTSL